MQYPISNIQCPTSSIQYPILDVGRRTSVVGRRTSDAGRRRSDVGRGTYCAVTLLQYCLVFGHWTKRRTVLKFVLWRHGEEVRSRRGEDRVGSVVCRSDVRSRPPPQARHGPGHGSAQGSMLTVLPPHRNGYSAFAGA